MATEMACQLNATVIPVLTGLLKHLHHRSPAFIFFSLCHGSPSMKHHNGSSIVVIALRTFPPLHNCFFHLAAPIPSFLFHFAMFKNCVWKSFCAPFCQCHRCGRTRCGRPEKIVTYHRCSFGCCTLWHTIRDKTVGHCRSQINTTTYVKWIEPKLG